MTPYYSDDWLTVYQGDCREVLASMEPESIHCVVTSPPYWQQRAYGSGPGELGGERTPEEYVAVMVDALAGGRRVLRADGCLWLNMGDAYAASGKGGGGSLKERPGWAGIIGRPGFRMPPPGYKMKDLTLVPFQLAHELRKHGWYLRSVVVWSKGIASEPPRLDRPPSAHEYVFLLTKSEQYALRGVAEAWWGSTVWTVMPDRGVDHPAVMPAELARRLIVTGCPEGGIVLDPFAGSGTTGRVAQRLGRRAVLIDLNGDYLVQAMRRNQDIPLGLETA